MHADFIPVDVVANYTLAAVWFTATRIYPHVRHDRYFRTIHSPATCDAELTAASGHGGDACVQLHHGLAEPVVVRPSQFALLEPWRWLLNMAPEVGFLTAFKLFPFEKNTVRRPKFTWSHPKHKLLFNVRLHPTYHSIAPFSPIWHHSLQIRTFFNHTLPALAIDGVLKLTFQRPKMRRLYEKMDKGFKELEYGDAMLLFTSTQPGSLCRTSGSGRRGTTTPSWPP